MRRLTGTGLPPPLALLLVPILASTLATTLATTSCGPDLALGPGSAESWEIIGGLESPPGSYPSVGVLLTRGQLTTGTAAAMVCTGTLIAPDVVLTAAHCTEIEQLVFMGAAEQIENFFSFTHDVQAYGNLTTEPPADAVAIRAMVAHPEWNLEQLETMGPGLVDLHDVALLFLDATVPGRTPSVVMAADDLSALQVNADVEIVGYGQRDPDDPSTVAIKFEADSFINEVGAAEMQIGDQPPGDPQKCHGDSGGPTFMDISDGQSPLQRLIGVTSHAYDQSDCHTGGVDTIVAPQLLWIDQAMRAACQDSTRVACAGGGGLAQPGGGSVTADAGTASDAGTSPDVEPGDAAVGIDTRLPTVRIDAGTSGPTPPSYMPPEVGERGCSCASSQSSSTSSSQSSSTSSSRRPLALLGLLALWRRRRR